MFDPVKLRLLSQQLAAPQFDNPVDLVSHFGALQGQEYRLMRWAVSMRTKTPSMASFEDAYNKGEIVRVHLMRGTWQLISGTDYRWMLRLFSSKAKSVINGWMRANGISISDNEYSTIRRLLLQCFKSCNSVTKEEFNKALLANEIVMDDHRLSYHLRMAELDGDICSGDLQAMKMTYSSTSDKIGYVSDIDLDESLYLMSVKFFRSHSPATLEDFVWWTGLSKTVCRKAISLCGSELSCEHFGDRDFYIHSSCRTDVSLCPRNSVILLPSYDEYLIGYKSRDIVLDPEFARRAHNNSRNFSPVIVQDARVVGNWLAFTPQVQTSFFDPAVIPSSNLPSELKRYSLFRGR